MSAIKIRNAVLALVLAVFSSLAWMPAHAQEMTCPEHTPVVIDIKPGSYPNSINLSSNGLLAVALMTTADFNAALFQPEMAHFSDASTVLSEGCTGAMPVRWALDDVNRDGKSDLVFFFAIRGLDLTSTSTEATLMAHGAYGSATLHIMGTDSVMIVSK